MEKQKKLPSLSLNIRFRCDAWHCCSHNVTIREQREGSADPLGMPVKEDAKNLDP